MKIPLHLHLPLPCLTKVLPLLLLLPLLSAPRAAAAGLPKSPSKSSSPLPGPTPPARLTAPPELGDEVAELRRLVGQAMEELLQLARQLRPSALDDHGLFSAIHSHARRFQADTGIKTDVNTEGEHAMLEMDQETAIYRIAQEALNNVAQHAGADHVEIELAARPGGGVSLSVRDDGRGFYTGHHNGGLGLGGMAERARLVGGSLDIRSGPGRGTELTLVVP